MGIKDKLKKTVIYTIYRWIKYLVYPYKLKRAKVVNIKPEKWMLSDELIENKKVIVSMTSFPGRIHLVHSAIYSIMNQSCKPNKIILWLSKRQFPRGNDELPKELIELEKYGLSINWLEEDIRSYKKLIPTLQTYPNDIIVTADDDLYYPHDWLKNLVVSYLQNPDMIHCYLINRLEKKNGNIIIDKRNKSEIGKASFNNKILGGSGTLYPPHSLHKDVLKEDAFMSLAPTNDDLWFWAMAIKNGTNICWINNGLKDIRDLCYVENSQEDTECLTDINDRGERLFDIQMNALVEKYNLYELLD